MTGAPYDNLTAIFIVCTLFVATVIVVPSISYRNILYVDEQQLRNVALETLKAILLGKGEPLNWGSGNFNPNAVKRFGLASSKSSSLYVLDPDKVERLVVGNPLGYLEYEKARQLLGLQDYGFYLRITAPFNVVVKDISKGTTSSYEVTVTFNDQKPIPNAVVNAILVYSQYVGGSSDSEVYSTRYMKMKFVTGELGKCTVKYEIAKTFVDFMWIFLTDVAEVTTITSVYGGASPDNIAEVNIVGNDIILTHPKYDPNDNRWIENIVVFTENGLTPMFNGTKSDSLNYGANDLWKQTFNGLESMDPTLLIFNINAVEKATGRKGTLVVGPYPNYLGSRVIHYGGTPKGDAVNVQRAVNISGTTYLVELVLWKEL